MLSDLDQVDSCLAPHRLPRGGVAPSRYDVALHTYVEKQRRVAQQTPATDAGAVWTLLARIVDFCAALITGSQAPRTRRYTASR